MKRIKKMKARPLPLSLEVDNTTEFRIEKNVPMTHRSSGRPMKYPLGQMQVGESFFIPKEKSNHCIAQTVRACSRRLGIKIATRTENGGMRVFRIA